MVLSQSMHVFALGLFSKKKCYYQLSNVIKQNLHFFSIFYEHDFIFTLQGKQKNTTLTIYYWLKIRVKSSSACDRGHIEKTLDTR